MKTNRKYTSIILMMILIATTITPALAQQPQNQVDRPEHPPLPSGEALNIQVPPPLDFPGLTNEQKEKIHQADIDHLKYTTPLHNQLREKSARLQTLLTTSPFDTKQASQVAEEMGNTETSLLKEMIRHDQELRNLLNTQQQVIFDARPKPFLRKPMTGLPKPKGPREE
ncbi:MAG: Spy/CpxP family protein refolding chaperone [Bacteroidales bacterium]